MKPYILADDSATEYKRLDLMSKILDPWTRGYLTALGSAKAGIALSWAAVMAASRSGSPPRSVVREALTAIEINPVLLELVPTQNVTVQQMDRRTGELPSQPYDLAPTRTTGRSAQ
jgi:hypothetical protein